MEVIRQEYFQKLLGWRTLNCLKNYVTIFQAGEPEAVLTANQNKIMTRPQGYPEGNGTEHSNQNEYRASRSRKAA